MKISTMNKQYILLFKPSKAYPDFESACRSD